MYVENKTVNVSDLIFKYYYDSKWKSIPEWAYSLMDLGAMLSRCSYDNKRLVLGLTTPLRNFNMSFIAIGVILQRIFESAVEQRRQERFQSLWSLQDGTAVYILQNNLQSRGKIKSHDDSRGILRVEIEKNGAECLINVDNCIILEPAMRDFRLSAQQNGTDVSLPFLLENILSENDIKPTLYSSLECLIVGTASLFEEELQVPIQYFADTHKSFEGTLGDLILPHRFKPKGKVYRSDVIPSRIEELEEHETLVSSETIILIDGASTFLRVSDNWSNNNMLVLLDPKNSEYSDAIQELNRRYTNRISDDKIATKEIPTWMDAMVIFEGLE